MSEDPNALPNQPEEIQPGRQPDTIQSPEPQPTRQPEKERPPEPQPEQTAQQPGAVPSPVPGQSVPANAEHSLPLGQQEGRARPSPQRNSGEQQYPPLPSFYQQAAVPDPYSAPPSSYNAAQPAPGMPPMMPPGYTYMPPGTPMMPPPGYTFVPPPGYGYMPPPGAPPIMPPPGYNYMPPPGYGPMPAGYGMPPFMPPIQPSHPLPLGQAIRELPRQYWKVLTRPGTRAFAEEQGKAEWGIVWMQLLFLVLLALIVAFLNATSGITNVFASLLNPRSNVAITPLSTNIVIIEGIILAILSPGFFLLGELIQFGLARLFRGNGAYVQQAYNHLLFLVPIQVVSSVFSVLLSFALRSFANPSVFSSTIIIALILDLVVLGLLVYSIVLNVFSIMAAHRISGGSASGVVLIPYGAVFVLYIIVIFIAVFASLALIR